jgi:hypothetical protein
MGGLCGSAEVALTVKEFRLNASVSPVSDDDQITAPETVVRVPLVTYNLPLVTPTCRGRFACADNVGASVAAPALESQNAYPPARSTALAVCPALPERCRCIARRDKAAPAIHAPEPDPDKRIKEQGRHCRQRDAPKVPDRSSIETRHRLLTTRTSRSEESKRFRITITHVPRILSFHIDIAHASRHPYKYQTFPLHSPPRSCYPRARRSSLKSEYPILQPSSGREA